nr:DUF2935 domain-containing protein [uncultured Cellulosilyticum sp.]
MESYIILSLELHLFFGRIMKEHALFLEVGYTQANSNYREEARKYKKSFEKLLRMVIKCSNGVVGSSILKSGELITEYTLESEKATSRLTGCSIDESITRLESDLMDMCMKKQTKIDGNMKNYVKQINQYGLKLLKGFIDFKERTLNYVLCCKMFTMNYPLLLEHIIREAKLYQQYIISLEGGNLNAHEDIRETELFWNQIMMEHALFIRGLLDPTENELIVSANQFAKQYASLLEDAKNMTEETMKSVTAKTIAETIKYRDFKAAGTEGINACQIRSLILPLLADHVLREANHYIRLLNEK